MTPIFYDASPETRAFWGGCLPHWDVRGRPIFLTLHVQGAIPRQAAERIREQAGVLENRPRAEVGYSSNAGGESDGCSSPRRPDAGGDSTAVTRDTEYTRRLKLVFRNMEKWLDRADQAPVLTDDRVSAMLRDAVEERERRGWWRLLHWVVMPSHVHILYVGGTKGMKPLMEDFKRWTGRQAAEILGWGGRRFWQEEWFDHWSRSETETDRMASYIRNNPVQAGLVPSSDMWRHGSWTVGSSPA